MCQGTNTLSSTTLWLANIWHQFIHAPRSAEINKFDDWPLQKHSPPWIYLGCPAKRKHIPLVGHAHLIHLWQNPSHTDSETYRSRNVDILSILLGLFRQERHENQTNTLENNADSSHIIRAGFQQDIELASMNGSTVRVNKMFSASEIQNSIDPGPRSSFVFLRMPKKTGERLLAENNAPPEGWGLYFEEGFQVHQFFLLILFIYILASLSFGLYWSIEYRLVAPNAGSGAWSVSSWMMGLMRLIVTVWFKWADWYIQLPIYQHSPA